MAVYFPESNILYIHFPKTGGISFYKELSNSNLVYENCGYQHDTVDLLGKRFFINKPKVVVFSREKRDWFKSYHRWRSLNKTEFELPGGNENWHPKWVLEEMFDFDFNKFMSNVQNIYSEYYENLCNRYYNHPTFDMTIYPFEDFEKSYTDLFNRLGHEIDFKNYPKSNATK